MNLLINLINALYLGLKKRNFHLVSKYFTCLLLCILFLISGRARGQSTIIWTGVTNSDWNTGSNWSTGAVPGTLDNVELGIKIVTNQPVVSGSFTVGSLTIGADPTTLTVGAGSSLAVTGNITQNHNTANTAPLNTLTGSGSISCGTLIVGNYTSSRIVQTATTELVSTVASLTINKDLVINSTTADLLSGGVGNNNALFSLQGGVVSLNGQIKMTNQIPAYLKTSAVINPLAKFSIDITGSQNATLILKDTGSINIANVRFAAIDFYNPISGTGTSTVNYSGSNQVVYSSSQAGLDQSPYIYQNLVISGTGTKTYGTVSGDQLTTGGNLTISSGIFDLRTLSDNLTVNGNFTNYGTLLLTASLGAVFQGWFFNAGTFSMPVSPGSAPIFFSGGNQQLTDSTATGTGFQFLKFTNAGTKRIHSGNFYVIPNGIVNIVRNAVVHVDSTATFTLRADTTGSSAIAAIPTGSNITGQVSVQQFIAGSVGTAARGYLFMSSPVNLSNSISGDRQYGINYLHGTSLTSGVFVGGPGGSANGFDNGSNVNPLMYINREDIPTCNATFLCGQARGVLKINYPDPNQIGTSTRYNNTSTPDTVIYMPIANGFQLYYLGNRVLSNGTTSGTKFTAPVNYPENVTLTNTGTINQSNVQVKVWFRSDHYLSYTNLSNSDDPGNNFLGNPYPSNINWDYLSTTNSNAQIYGPNLKTTIYIENPINHQEQPYQADSTHDRNTVYYGVGLASNIIHPSQGFGVTVDASSANPYAASLLLREGCKQNNQVTDTAQINTMMANARLKTNALVLSSRTPQVRNTVTPAKVAAKANRNTPHVVKTEDKKLIRLKLYNIDKDTVSNNDEILIQFKRSAKEKYLSGEDAYDLVDIPNMATVMLSSYSSDHIPLSINTLPLPAKDQKILLFTDGTESGNYRLLLTQLDNIPVKYQLKLIDKFTGKAIDIRKVKEVDFQIDKNNSLTFGDRFVINIVNNNRKK
jgi:hypothetical protein